MKEFADLQDRGDIVASQRESQNNVSQKLASDEDILALIDKVAGNVVLVRCHEHASCKFLQIWKFRPVSGFVTMFTF